MAEARFRARRRRGAAEEDFPLGDVEVEVAIRLASHVEMPDSALRRLALRELRRAVGELDAKHLVDVADAAAHAGPGPAAIVPAAVPTPILVASDGQGHWDARTAPAPGLGPGDLDRRIVRSAHRLVEAVVRRHPAGDVTVADLAGILSPPTLARLLDPATDGGAYCAQFLTTEPAGRTRRIRLTAAGHALGVRVLAGDVLV